MPRYRFDGFHETVLMGLSHGVNADVHRVGEDGVPVDFTGLAESTVVVLPGDEITTAEAYENAWMTDLDAPDPEPARERKPRKPRAPRTQTPPANQADPDSTSTSTDPEGEE